MKNLAIYFQLHQPYRLRRYRFFDIGNAHYYNDDYMNEDIFQRIANSSYKPANKLFLDLLREYPDFKLNYIISGLVIEQMEYYAPDLIDGFRALVDTGRVEILVEPYAHSVASLYDMVEFKAQVKMQRHKLKELFGIDAKVFCNTELIYNEDIAKAIEELGFDGVLTEGAKHILGWKSPNYLYSSPNASRLKLLLRNAYLSDIIVKDFSNYSSPNYPVTADRILSEVSSLSEGEDIINLYMPYETLGVMHNRSTGIFDFFAALPRIAKDVNIGFANASDIIKSFDAVSTITVNYPISTSGEEKGVNEWNGNILQQGALKKLKEWGDRVRAVPNGGILQDWIYLQAADHFYYMNTINNGGGIYSPYTSPYDAFNNYMNVLSDLLIRIEGKFPSTMSTDELNAYEKTIQNQDKRIKELEDKIKKLSKNK